MKNILRESTDLDELKKVFAECPPRSLFPEIKDAAWGRLSSEEVLRRWAGPIREQALEFIRQGEHLPELTDAMYADFHITGNRLPFETPYFERNRMIAALVFAFLQARDETEKQKCLAALIRVLEARMEESSWALPACVQNKSGKDPMCLDLFAAEFFNSLGELIQLFGELLPPQLVASIRARLQKEGFENYLEGDFWWMHGNNNWNAVCQQGVLGAALAIVEDADLLARLFMRARQFLPNFINGFADDGGCSEGPGYWTYGFGWFCALNWQLEHRTRGRFSIFEGDAKLREVSRYWGKITLSDGHVVNFADAGVQTAVSTPLPSWILQYLANRWGDEEMAAAARESCLYYQYNPHGIRNDFFNFVRRFLLCPDMSGPTPAISLRDDWLPKLVVMVSRTRTSDGHLVELGAKGGHNDESHNHNDIGSYMLNVDGERMLVEIGAPEYVKATFGPERFTFNAMRSRGHSVPLINGTEQKEGRDFRSEVLRQSFSDKKAELVLDMTRAYPAEAACTRLIRNMLLDKQSGKFTVQDEIEVEKPLEVTDTAIISDVEPVMEETTALLRRGKSTIRIRPLKGSVILGVKTLDYRTHTGEDACVYRLSIGAEKPANEVKIGYEVEVVDA